MGTNAFDVLGKRAPKPKKYKPKLEIRFNDDGTFKMPIKIAKDGSKMIMNLGEICTENKFHNASNIYPVGYKCAVAKLPSLTRPGKTTTFKTVICKGETGPIFEITCSDDKDFKLTGPNATNVWNQLGVKWQALSDESSPKNIDQKENEAPETTTVPNANPIAATAANDASDKGKKSPKGSPKSKISGPNKIGLSHADIKRALECLPNVEKLTKYKFKYRTDKEPIASSKKAWKKSLKGQKSKKKKSKENATAATANATITNVNVTNINQVNNINIINNITLSPMGKKPQPPMPLNKDNPIVIEDSPTASNPEAKTDGVIDLCDSDADNDGKEKTKLSRKRKHPLSPQKIETNDENQPMKKRKISILEPQE